MTVSLARLQSRLAEIHHLNGALNLLGWDQEVTMPAGGAGARAGQRGALAAAIHQKLVDPQFGRLLDDLAGDDALAAGARANLRLARRLRERALRLPATLVSELAAATALAQREWVQARRDSDWDRFAPHLDGLVRLKRQEAAALQDGGEPYDALLDEFEPGATTATLRPVFAALQPALCELRARVGDRLRGRPGLFAGPFARSRQESLCRRVLAAIGFVFDQGRLDVSPHPFTESIGAGDVRLTTSFDVGKPLSGLYALLHEGGHALYEQGLPAAHRETPAGQPASLGIHESQSQLWENHVGRSLPFCRWLAPLLQATFAARLPALPAEDLYREVNVVAPTAIRILADEISYNLHIILRWEIERALIAGDIAAGDVPPLWRSRAREYLDVAVADDRGGALQDIHWSAGAFGYFPTYTLGNLYAAMFWQVARRDLPGLDGDVAAGRFGGLLAWLRRHIHARGSLVTASELCREVTGRDLAAGPFLAYLTDKYGELCAL